jgi:hypothetical protein
LVQSSFCRESGAPVINAQGIAKIEYAVPEKAAEAALDAA